MLKLCTPEGLNRSEETIMQPIIITSEKYRHYVEVAKKINEIADNVYDKDQKKKFLMRGYPPTVDQLMMHNVDENMGKFISYLIYYHEYDISDFIYKDEMWNETNKYINDLIKENVVIQEAERGNKKMTVSFDDFDEMIEKNAEMCKKEYPKLTNYEKDIFYGNTPITLERLQSVDPHVEFERLLPFLLRIQDPTLSKNSVLLQGLDGALIKKYLQHLFYDCLELQ